MFRFTSKEEIQAADWNSRLNRSSGREIRNISGGFLWIHSRNHPAQPQPGDVLLTFILKIGTQQQHRQANIIPVSGDFILGLKYLTNLDLTIWIRKGNSEITQVWINKLMRSPYLLVTKTQFSLSDVRLWSQECQQPQYCGPLPRMSDTTTTFNTAQPIREQDWRLLTNKMPGLSLMMSSSTKYNTTNLAASIHFLFSAHSAAWRSHRNS